LRFIADELGGHTSKSHVAILPASSSVSKTTLSRAGFEYILYDDSSGHAYAAACLKELLAQTRTRTSRSSIVTKRIRTDTAGGTEEFAALVSAFLSLTNPDRGSTYDTAAAAIVLSELKTLPITESFLRNRIANRLRVAVWIGDSCRCGSTDQSTRGMRRN
jgi:hypothetical protein